MTAPAPATPLAIDAAVRLGEFSLEARVEIPSGETTVLLGPNGSGKSTLVRAVAGLVPLDRGRIALGDRVLDDAAAGVRLAPAARGVGIAPQGAVLFPHLTIIENAAFPLEARGVPRTDARREAAAWLDRLGVGHRAGARPAEVSGGEAGRAALARALVGRPGILLLDEPLAAVDAAGRDEIRGVLRRTLAGFAGVRIVVTHDATEAAEIADRVVVMEAGRVVQAGGVADLRRAPATPFVAAFAGLNVLRGVARREGDLVRVEATDGAAAGGILYVASDAARDGDEVVAVVRPAAVSLFRARPETSARNLFEGTVRSIRTEGAHAWVVVETLPPLTAEITPAAVGDLGLEPGARVWVAVKATEVEVHA